MRLLKVPGDDRELGADWLVCSVGNSSDDGADYYVTTDRLHATDIPEALQDSSTTGALIVRLLNEYFQREARKRTKRARQGRLPW